MDCISSRVFLAQFPSENGQAPPPPEEILVKRKFPPEPEKIARYLVLSTQKRQKIGDQKKLPPENPFSGRFTRGVRKNFF